MKPYNWFFFESNIIRDLSHDTACHQYQVCRDMWIDYHNAKLIKLIVTCAEDSIIRAEIKTIAVEMH